MRCAAIRGASTAAGVGWLVVRDASTRVTGGTKYSYTKGNLSSSTANILIGTIGMLLPIVERTHECAVLRGGGGQMQAVQMSSDVGLGALA